MRRLLLFILVCLPAFGWADPFDELLAEQAEPGEAPDDLLGQTDSATVDLPLERVITARAALSEKADALNRPQAPPVRMVAAHYRGDATADRLKLTVDLDVALGRPGAWKTVPLLGQGAVLVSARRGDVPLPLTTRKGYTVWMTQESGSVRITLDVLVPSGGKRGAIAFDFGIARTPVTRFECDFDQPDLTPHITGAVNSQITPIPGGTRFDATLPPTLQVKLVGPRAIGDAEKRPAQIFVDSRTLIAVDDQVDLFTELDATLLYAPVETFRVRLPPDTTVISASGAGAFSHRQEGDVLIVSTGEPVKDKYMIALHLRRALPPAKTPGETRAELAIALPEVEGAERQAGWVAMEASGNFRLVESRATGISAVDVRELPKALREAAVTPVLKAWRHDAPGFDLALDVERLEGVPVAYAAVDEVVAFSALSTQGTLLTEMRMLFYNQQRRRLAVRLPSGARIRSAILNGAPIGASQDADGRVLLPLNQSADDTLEVSIIVEQPMDAPGLLGQLDFALPTLDLPVRLVRWSVFLPQSQTYGALRADIAPQHRRGSLRWRRPNLDFESSPTRAGQALQAVGQTPVRINVPRTGHRLNFKRYWIAAGTPIETHVRHVQTTLINLGVLLGCAGVLVALLGMRRRWPLLIAVGLAVGVYTVAGGIPLLITGVLWGMICAWRGRWVQRLWPALVKGTRQGIARLRRLRPRRPASWKVALRQAALALGMAWIGLNIAELIAPAVRVFWP